MLAFGLTNGIDTVSGAIDSSVNGLIFNLANPFNGTLLHRDLIEVVGFIKREMFIWGDENEYFKRLSSLGFEFASVTSAFFVHPASKSIYSEKFFGLVKMVSKPAKLEMNFYRNQGFLNARYGSLRSHIVVLKNFIFFCFDGKFKRAFLSFAYYMDGALNRYKLKNIR